MMVSIVIIQSLKLVIQVNVIMIYMCKREMLCCVRMLYRFGEFERVKWSLVELFVAIALTLSACRCT